MIGKFPASNNKKEKRKNNPRQEPHASTSSVRRKRSKPWFYCTMPRCGTVFTNEKMMQHHVYQQHMAMMKVRSVFYCDVDHCNYESPYHHSLRRHQTGAHTNMTFYVCRFASCKRHFAHLEHVMIHEQEHRLMSMDPSLNLSPHYIRITPCPARLSPITRTRSTMMMMMNEETLSRCVHVCILFGCSFRGKSKEELIQHRRECHS